MSRLAIFAALMVYAVFLGVAAPVALRRAQWVTRAPGLAIVLWQALSVSWLASVTLAGLNLTVPWLAGWSPRSTAETVTAALGASLAITTVARTFYILARELLIAERMRRRHAERLAYAGRALTSVAATLIDSEIPAVYCLASRRRRQQIVITSSALGVLEPDELAAVVAHEQAHLRARHHRKTAAATALRLAFPFVPLLRDARGEIVILAEMAADDAASRIYGAATTARALTSLATARVPAPALGGGGHTVLHRALRLLTPPPPLRRPARIAGVAAAAGSFVVPAGLACAPIMILATLAASQIAG